MVERHFSKLEVSLITARRLACLQSIDSQLCELSVEADLDWFANAIADD